jgi:hypothetical protein
MLGRNKDSCLGGRKTPLETIATTIESANIGFRDVGDGTTWEHIYKSTEECNHLARAVVAGLQK